MAVSAMTSAMDAARSSQVGTSRGGGPLWLELPNPCFTAATNLP